MSVRRTACFALLLLIGFAYPMGGGSAVGATSGQAQAGPTLGRLIPSRLDPSPGPEPSPALRLLVSATEEAAGGGEDRPSQCAVPFSGFEPVNSPTLWIGRSASGALRSTHAVGGEARGPPVLG